MLQTDKAREAEMVAVKAFNTNEPGNMSAVHTRNSSETEKIAVQVFNSSELENIAVYVFNSTKPEKMTLQVGNASEPEKSPIGLREDNCFDPVIAQLDRFNIYVMCKGTGAPSRILVFLQVHLMPVNQKKLQWR